MSDDLARFIAERLDDEERDAQAAKGSRWAVHGADPDVWVGGESDDPRGAVTTHPEGGHPEGSVSRRSAEHIARHDPARVLAFVAAGRAILELHRPWDPTWPDECVTCDQNSTPWVRTRAEWPCPTLRAFGTIWAGHPAWREEWRA